MVKTLERLTAVLRTVSLMLFCGLAPTLNAQTDKVIADLVSMGFENVRCTEDSAEVVYSVVLPRLYEKSNRRDWSRGKNVS